MADVKSTASEDVQSKILDAMGIPNKPVEEPTPEPVVEPTPEPVAQTEPQPIEEPTGVVETPAEPKPDGEGKETPVDSGTEEGVSQGEEVVEPALELDDDGNIINWDDTPVEPESGASQIDYQAIGNALGFEVSSVEDIQNRFNELTSQNEELSSTSESYANLPDSLKIAVEAAQDGGDWRAMLDMDRLDYSKVDPVDLFAADALELFKDDTGQVDRERYEAYIQTFSDDQMLIEGKKLQRNLIQQQELQKKELSLQLEQRKAQEDQRLKEALNNFNQIADFKINKEHKQKLYNDLTSGNALNRLFYDNQGNYDYNKIVRAIFTMDKFDQMISVAKNRARTDKTREVLNDLTNNTVAKPKAEPVNPEVKQKDPMELMIEHSMNQSMNPFEALMREQQNK